MRRRHAQQAMREVIATGILLSATRASAQDPAGRWLPPWLPHLAVSIRSVGDAGDSGQSNRIRHVGATIGLPVAGGISFDDQELRAFLLTLEGGVQASSLSLPFSAEPRDVFALEGGIAGAHLLGGQTVLVWSAEGGFAEDDRTVRSAKPRLSGSVFVIRPRSRQLTLLYGGLSSFVFTKPLILPMFGVLWHPQAATSVVVFAPLSGSVFRGIGSRLIVGAGVGLMGDRFRIANDKERFPGVSDTVDLRMHELRIDGTAGVRIARGLVLAVEGGVSVLRVLSASVHDLWLPALSPAWCL